MRNSPNLLYPGLDLSFGMEYMLKHSFFMCCTNFQQALNRFFSSGFSLSFCRNRVLISKMSEMFPSSRPSVFCISWRVLKKNTKKQWCYCNPYLPGKAGENSKKLKPNKNYLLQIHIFESHNCPFNVISQFSHLAFCWFLNNFSGCKIVKKSAQIPNLLTRKKTVFSRQFIHFPKNILKMYVVFILHVNINWARIK